MQRLLAWMSAMATRRPRAVVAALVAVTVGAAALASNNEFEVDLTRLGSDDAEAVQAMDRLRDEFADPTAAVQVILDAGPGGDLLGREGLAAVAAAEEVALSALGPDARTDEDGRPQVLSLRSARGAGPGGRPAAPGAGDTPPAGAGDTPPDDTPPGVAVARAAATNPQLAALVSDDLDVEAGTARGTVVVVPLDPGLSEAERTDAAERVAAAFAGDPGEVPADVDVTVFSSGLFVSGLLDAIRAEVPLLFGLALLVVLAILALAYRSPFDVAVGFAGMVATVVVTFGVVALVGPAVLGWTGPLTQLAVIVPVLLVGLGIDYAVHLTARYREQRAAGQPPPAAADRALRTVGTALVLATAATAIGFASIATAPLGMLADFGVFVAVGVVVAFTIMGFLVPAARVWRDQRRTDGTTAVRELGLARLMAAPVGLARRRPWAGMTVAAVLVAVSLLAATGLEIEFDRDDFVPEGSDVAATLAHQEELFGGGVTETTYAIVDGDLTDPAVADAVWEAQMRAGTVPGVRTVDGTPQVASVLSVLAAADPDGGVWAGGGVADDADLHAAFARLRQAVGDVRVDQLLAPDDRAAVVQLRTTVGDAGAARVHREVAQAFAPVESAGAAVTVTSEPIIIAGMSQELAAFQARSIGLTLAVVLVLLTAYYGLVRRRPLLGVIAMIPAVVGASLVVGTMWVLGIAFNVLTATLTGIAIGIGVPYGVHVVNRVAEDLEQAGSDAAVAGTLRRTGGALAGSALTTLGAFVVLSFSGLPPIRSLGLLGGAGIAFALLAAVLVEPGALVLWARRRERRAGQGRDRDPAPDRAPAAG